MAKKEEKLEEQNATQQAAAAPSETPNHDKWFANMRSKHGEDKTDEELYDLSMKGYDEEHEYAKQGRKDAQELAGIVGQYPEIAASFAELSAGNIGEAILNLGDLVEAYRSGEIDDDKYKAAVAKRKEESDAAAAAEEEKKAKIAAQDEVFTQWCEKKGYDPEEWMQKATEQLFKPMSSYAMAEAQFDAIDRMLNYDEDMEAAEVRGRNANISAQRKKSAGATDGQANRASAAAAGTSSEQESRLRSIAKNREYARNL